MKRERFTVVAIYCSLKRAAPKGMQLAEHIHSCGKEPVEAHIWNFVFSFTDLDTW